eukprot:CAMPEP_0204585498 /NCGR_PEP_ID=MMETSP0661-20131031/46958_1 /ASSEMBLY_ACC=CAM_ASM_000606 /TAXON_ID=109239 /ORGANISM="Alexandrium margalefi, Strain AMGDE01CS-322" /LENGTH=81 /DNA_ID=CAMNT_0051595055 /DNA_START=38 /DNA_END=279 /DNA_ORIENTATION=+
MAAPETALHTPETLGPVVGGLHTAACGDARRTPRSEGLGVNRAIPGRDAGGHSLGSPGFQRAGCRGRGPACQASPPAPPSP